MSDSFTTAVPGLTLTSTGFVAPSENAILVGVQSDINQALGGNVNPQLSTPQGQLATTETAVIGDSNATLLAFFAGIDPATSSGRLQDALGRIYFQTRIPGTPTVQPCVCAGLPTTQIPIGILAQDQAQNIWICQQAGTLGSLGSITLNFAATANGPIPAPSSLTIYQGPFGLETITPTGDAVLGNDVESAAAFEARRKASVAANAVQILDAIQGQVLAVPGVLDCYCFENDASSPTIVGGVSIGANSIYVCTFGGTQSAIAFAIWSKKGPGCAYTGNTFTTVTDPNPVYNPPAPTYTVAYETPTVVAFVAQVTLQSNAGIPANALVLVQTAIINAFAGLDGGARAKIGSLVLASRYYAGVVLLGSWAQLVSLQIGTLASGATFTGSISGSTLTVSAVAAGALAVGQLVQDASLLAGLGVTITAQLTGSAGGIGTYSLSASHSIGSETMTSSTLVNEVQMNINQVPAVSAGNINLVIT